MDLAMPEVFQNFLVERARDKGVAIDVKVMRSGHFVQISHAEEVASWITELSS